MKRLILVLVALGTLAAAAANTERICVTEYKGSYMEWNNHTGWTRVQGEQVTVCKNVKVKDGGNIKLDYNGRRIHITGRG